MLQNAAAAAERAVPVPVSTRTDKLMARIALVIVTGGILYGAYALGGPLWWKFYATVVHPYEDSVKGTQSVVGELRLPRRAAMGRRSQLGGAGFLAVPSLEPATPSAPPPPVLCLVPGLMAKPVSICDCTCACCRRLIGQARCLNNGG